MNSYRCTGGEIGKKKEENRNESNERKENKENVCVSGTSQVGGHANSQQCSVKVQLY